MCVTKLRVKDGVCVKVTWARDSADIFFSPALQCHLLCMRHHCGPGMGWMRCSMIFCAPCAATRCSTWQPRLSYSHESDDDDIEERYLAAKVVEHECSWLSMQLWKTSTIYLVTERMPVKSRYSHSGKHHGYDANCAVYPKYVNQPQISETHRHHRHSKRCRLRGVVTISFVTCRRTHSCKRTVRMYKQQSMALTPVTTPQRNGHCSNTKRYKTWKEVNVDTGMRHPRRLFSVASTPMLIPLEHRHLVTLLQCQWTWFFAHCAKPLRQTNVKACHFQLSRNKSRRVCGRLQPVNYEESRRLP